MAGFPTTRCDRTASEGTCITLDRAETTLWTDELYPELAHRDDAEDLAGSEFTRRAAPYCLRIAGLFAVLDGRGQIGKDDLAAERSADPLQGRVGGYVLDGVHRDPRADRLYTRAIDAAGASPSDPHRHLGRSAGSSTVGRAG